MLNLFKSSKKDPGKTTPKLAKTGSGGENKTTANQNKTGSRTWFAKSPQKATKNIKDIKIRPISGSTPSLTRPLPHHENNSKKIKRPVSIVTNVRGQSSKIEGQTPEDLSRASSINNLNVGLEQQKSSSKGAKPKKADSKDKLDKLGESRRHDNTTNKQLTNNLRNNNRESSTIGSTDCDLTELQKQLVQMANEKANLVLQLNEQHGQLNVLQNEIVKLKLLQEESCQKVDQLNEDNTILRNRLRDVAHSPLSDTEKQQLLYDTQHRHHSSAPASIATNLLDDGGDVTACPTPEWDKHSSSNVSEVSVACLQDKINQMQETHYSTNEELQATLQELTDLQRQLTELQQENLRLNDEKNLMFESLCRQTERLNDSRNEVDSLKQLLYNKNDENGQFETSAEREEKLLDLLKSAQEEREELLMKQDQLSVDLENSQGACLLANNEVVQLTNRVKTLESTLDAKHAEHKLLDQELALAKDQSSGRQIEINRLKELLENARAKIYEFEQNRDLLDKSEFDELLDNARKEKDALEIDITHLREQLALTKNENDKLKEQISILQEECKVIRNNAKTTQSDLEYKLNNLIIEKNAMTEQLQQFQEVVNELQLQNQCQIDDKRQLSTVLSETQRNLNETESRNCQLENELAELKKIKQEQEDEWEHFQNDLLTSVRVANDFKTEAQQDIQRLIMENKAGRERIKQLELQIEKMKAPPATNETIPLRPSTFQVVDDHLGGSTTRRPKLTLSRQNSRQSVKSLIESIENAGKPLGGNKTISMSRSSSTSSVNSITTPTDLPISTPTITTPNSPEQQQQQQPMKTPLKEQQPNKMNRVCGGGGGGDKNDLIKTKSETILQKGLDYNRRNSYSDLSDRKDPLNGLVKNGGSKRNALLKWCQNKTVGYRNIDITNFSSSWNDGLALCALLHTYLPDRIPYDSLTQQEKRRNFSLAFSAAESVGIPTTLNINDMIQLERPDWQQVMSYVTAIYKHFET